MVRSFSHQKASRIIGMVAVVLLSIVATPTTVWGQWQTGGSNIYYNNGNVGVGTSSPQRNLHIFSGGGWPELLIESTFAAGSVGRMWGLGTDNGTGKLYIRALDASLSNVTTALWIQPNGNIGIGTINPQYKLAVNGSFGAQDVIVTNSGWADYVFHRDYRLPPLSEVGDFIKANGHLPNIPTEEDVKKNGVSVGDMQAKLLAKIEELTLHMIRADERNNRLESQNRELQERLTRLEKAAARESTDREAK